MIDVTKYGVCGMDCTKCPLYVSTIKSDLDSIRKILMIGPEKEVSLTKNGCYGCSAEINHQMCNTCYMRNCAYKQGIKSCGLCEKYPCDYLSILSSETKKRLNQFNLEFKKNKGL